MSTTADPADEGPDQDRTSPSSPAFSTFGFADCASPILIAAPHCGRRYDARTLAAMRDPELTALRLEDRYVDVLARAVAEQCGASLILAEVPRALIDLNRAPDDIDWGMVSGGRGRASPHSLANRRARSGLGIVPRRLPGSGEIWRAPLSREELEQRIDEVHRPYHEAISAQLQTLRDRWGVALLIDLHSMPPLKRRFANEQAAEFVIGDRFGSSCGHRIVAHALQLMAERGRVVTHNRPYAGGYVLDRHGAPARGIHAIQVEVCRSTYLCADLAELSARVPAVVKTLVGLVRSLAELLVFFDDDDRRMAAE